MKCLVLIYCLQHSSSVHVSLKTLQASISVYTRNTTDLKVSNDHYYYYYYEGDDDDILRGAGIIHR